MLKTPLQREIVWVVVLKLAALYLLWYAFFAHPITPQLTQTHIQQHF